jgi:acyl-CoA ligase (AMP-forming) (exosortase A-associated)
MDYLVHHLLYSSAERLPEKEALVHEDERLSYSAVYWAVTSFAHGLKLTGLQRGDRLGILLKSSIPQALSIFAASAAGAVFVPIHEVLFPDQVAHIVADCGVKGLVTTAAKLASLNGVFQRMPSLAFAVVVDESDAPQVPIAVHRFEQLCSVDAGPQTDACIGRDLAAILYTSGSSGKPKGVMLTHTNIIAGARIVSTYLGITENDRTLAALPFTFDAGLNQMMTAIQQGGTTVLIQFTLARDIVRVLLRERISGLTGIPTLWCLLAHPHSTLMKTPLPQLRYIANTGGSLPQNVLATLMQALPATAVFLMYGLTEAFRSTYLPPDELDRRPNSIGKAVPNTEILVVDRDGKPCAPWEVGELVHRGPTVAAGYWGKPELTDQVFRPHPWMPPELLHRETVCYSGDLVKTDDEGFLYYVGRKDSMIKSSGFRISPTEVEEVLLQIGTVLEAAVIGVPDDLVGQHIKAFVVSSDPDSPNGQAISRHCSDKLPRHMVPKEVEFLEELPKTPNGKVDYSALKVSPIKPD